MNRSLIHVPRTIMLSAAASPPRDRTTRGLKAARHCRDEWQRAYELAKGKGQPATKAIRMATMAYKLAMPEMDTLPAIRASICCIAQGIRLEVFDGRDGSQLLYAAQVALSMLREEGGRK